MTRSTAFLWFGGLLIVGLVSVAAAGVYLYQRAEEPFKGYDAPELFVDLPAGSSTQAIGSRLVAAGVIRDRLSFRIALWRTGAARRLKAGEYRFDRPMTARQVVDKIARGEVSLLTITFPEGLTIREMAAVFEEHGFGPASEFRAAARDAGLVQDLDPQARDLEGYLFPDTYRVPRRSTAADLVDIMVRRFRHAFTPALASEAQGRRLSVRQAVTLGSLIEKETAKPEERPIVAAVYTNRLKIGMGLQCDPTVIYALALAGRYKGNLTRADLLLDSPYNTYRHAGLPPGPIASPGQPSIEAAIRPADVDFLYFVSRNDGSHEFARDLAAHNRNVQRYQVQYFQEKRLQEARERNRKAPAPRRDR
jgi:UPF0755 protein